MACKDVLSQGYQVTDEFWKERAEQTVTGWKAQLKRDGAQAWTLIVSNKEINYEAECEADESEKNKKEDEETKVDDI